MPFLGLRRIVLAGALAWWGVCQWSFPGVLASESEEIQLDPRLQALLADLARNVIPHDYENEKDWGKTKEVVRGLYIKREGLRIKTHRTRKAVNHGTWTRYRVQLLDPEQQFHVRLENMRRFPEPRFKFDVICDARVRIFGRLSQWQRGIQLVSLSAEADTDIRLIMQCDVTPRLSLRDNLPDLTIDPLVRTADLQIRNFRMRHISRLDGPLVKTLSASVREVLEDEIEKRRERLVVQINRQIDKKRELLRLSPEDFFSKSPDQDTSTTRIPAQEGDGRS
jgi:hypothetical protein